MRLWAPAVVAAAAVLVVSGCGGSGARKPAPSVGSDGHGEPPVGTARLREEVRVARSANRLFSIFPAVPGTKSCAIPRAARPGQHFRGSCRTSVRARRTIEPSESVTFTESWWPHCPPMTACSPRTLRHHTWQVVEGETIVRPGTKPRVYAIHSRGATAPQHRT